MLHQLQHDCGAISPEQEDLKSAAKCLKLNKINTNI